jgi:hypothetical protein
MRDEALQLDDGTSRRDFLKKAAVGLAAAFGLGEGLRRGLFRSKGAGPVGGFDEDSLFWPRADQVDKVIGR